MKNKQKLTNRFTKDINLRNYFVILLSAFLFTVYSFSCIHEENQQLYNSTERITNTVSTSIKEINVPKEALALINAYPEYVIGYKDNLLFFFDSTSIIFDDAIIKTEQELLNNADINDMFIYTYPKGATLPNFKPKYDPGRIRNELFFKKIYGSSKEEVINNFKTILNSTLNKNSKIILLFLYTYFIRL